jgi:hypothetical protein
VNGGELFSLHPQLRGDIRSTDNGAIVLYNKDTPGPAELLSVENGKEIGNIHQRTDGADKPGRALFENRDINLDVIRSVALIVSYIRHVHGAAVLGDGLPVPFLPLRIVQRFVTHTAEMQWRSPAGCWRLRARRSIETRPMLLVQKKKLRVGPYVAGVPRNEKGQIAHQRQPFSVSMCPQSIGLSEQKELRKARLADLIGEFTTHLLEGCWLPLDQFGWPCEAVRVPEFGFKCAEQGIILKPAILVVTKSLMVPTEVRAGTTSEPIPSLFEYPMLEGYDRGIIYEIHGERWMLAVACG